MTDHVAKITRAPALDGERRPPMPFIATPAYGAQVFTPFAKSLLALAQGMQAAGLEHVISILPGESLIPRARNRLVAEFLKTKCDPLVFIDADIDFDPKDVAIAVKSELDVVVGAYPMKTIGWQNVADAARAGVEPDKLVEVAGLYAVNPKVADHASGEATVKAHQGHHFLEVLDGATGFMCIRRRVFEKMIREWGSELGYIADYVPNRGDTHYAFFDSYVGGSARREAALFALHKAARAIANGEMESVKIIAAAREWAQACADDGEARYLSEDYLFSRRCQALGIPIHLNIGAKLSHMGAYVFRGDIASIIQVQPARAPRPPADPSAPLPVEFADPS